MVDFIADVRLHCCPAAMQPQLPGRRQKGAKRRTAAVPQFYRSPRSQIDNDDNVGHSPAASGGAYGIGQILPMRSLAGISQDDAKTHQPTQSIIGTALAPFWTTHPSTEPTKEAIDE